MMTVIADNLTGVRGRIAAAAVAAGRDAGKVKLIAVSKTYSVADIEAALTAGQRRFGENRVQEAKAKFPALRDRYPDLELHLIGALQSNKADEAVRLFDVIHTLDRSSLAQALAKAIAKTGKSPRLLVEVNLGGEAQKAGVAPDELADFMAYCRGLGLEIDGLMCLPPQGRDPQVFFSMLQGQAAQHKLAELSMGMSGDFASAIACGATFVRVGTAIFGPRAIV